MEICTSDNCHAYQRPLHVRESRQTRNPQTIRKNNHHFSFKAFWIRRYITQFLPIRILHKTNGNSVSGFGFFFYTLFLIHTPTFFSL